MSISKENKRLFALDLLRVLACFLVVWQHVTECYYINPDMTAQTHDGMSIIGWMNSMTPIEVPLFRSSYDGLHLARMVGRCLL